MNITQLSHIHLLERPVKRIRSITVFLIIMAFAPAGGTEPVAGSNIRKQAGASGKMLKIISLDPKEGKPVGGRSMLRAEILVNIPGFSPDDQYLLRVYLRSMKKGEAGRYFVDTYDITSPRTKMYIIVPICTVLGGFGQGEVGVDFAVAEKKRGLHAPLHIMATVTKKYMNTGEGISPESRRINWERRTDSLDTGNDSFGNIEPVVMKIRDLNKADGSTILPGGEITGTVDYRIPGYSGTRRYIIYLYEILGNRYRLVKKFHIPSGSGSIPFSYTSPPGRRGDGDLTIRFVVNRYSRMGFLPVFTCDAVRYKTGKH